MDSLFDILNRKDFDQPSEVKAIKQYVKQEFGVEVAIQVRDKDIIIFGKNSALVGSLRLRVRQLQKAAQTDKRLIFRVG